MANTRDLRRRIKSIKNTAQITKAMQMVAATKMRKAQNQALNGRPYSLNLNEALQRLLPLVDIEDHVFLRGNAAKVIGIVLLTTDKSLCGALNTNLFRLLSASSFTDSVFYTVGKKGRNFAARTGRNLQADFENLDIVTFRQAVQLSKLITGAFLAGEIGEAYLIFPQFVSTLRQEPTKVKFLPIELDPLLKTSQDDRSQFLFEPEPDRLLDYILTHHIQFKIYQALLETKASEHSARMMAMQNATDNALELVDDLRLTYNQTRQDAITKELSEITTAAMAMT